MKYLTSKFVLFSIVSLGLSANIDGGLPVPNQAPLRIVLQQVAPVFLGIPLNTLWSCPVHSGHPNLIEVDEIPEAISF